MTIALVFLELLALLLWANRVKSLMELQWDTKNKRLMVGVHKRNKKERLHRSMKMLVWTVVPLIVPVITLVSMFN